MEMKVEGGRCLDIQVHQAPCLDLQPQACLLEVPECWEVQEIQKRHRIKNTENTKIRIIRGRVYDPVNGKTCHWCRQKTLEERVKCSRCPVHYCGQCLRNRNGEDLRIENDEGEGQWVCPRCRRGCGAGCYNCCNCGPCRATQGLAPTGCVIHTARLHGFSNVHDYLISLATGETPIQISFRKLGKGWCKTPPNFFSCLPPVRSRSRSLIIHRNNHKRKRGPLDPHGFGTKRLKGQDRPSYYLKDAPEKENPTFPKLFFRVSSKTGKFRLRKVSCYNVQQFLGNPECRSRRLHKGKSEKRHKISKSLYKRSKRESRIQGSYAMISLDEKELADFVALFSNFSLKEAPWLKGCVKTDDNPEPCISTNGLSPLNSELTFQSPPRSQIDHKEEASLHRLHSRSFSNRFDLEASLESYLQLGCDSQDFEYLWILIAQYSPWV